MLDVPNTVGHDLAKYELDRLEKIQRKQKDLHRKLGTKIPKGPEAEAIKWANSNEFADFWGSYCQKAVEAFEHRHTEGWRRVTRNFQEFSKEVNDFMTRMKPLFDVCKEASPPYASSAVATLTILFALAASKSRLEEKLLLVIENVTARLPEFKVLEACYGSKSDLGKDLSRKMLLAHMAFIDFAVDAATYFTQPGYRRWSNAFFRTTKFDDAITQIKQQCDAVKSQCDTLLHQTISELSIDSRRRAEDLQLGQGNTYLRQLQKTLGISTWSPESQAEDLERYRRSLRGEEYYEDTYERMTKDKIDEFRCENAAIAETFRGSESSFLILTGVNNTNIAELKRHCWLSPIALDAIHRLQSDGSTLAYYLFQEPPRATIRWAVAVIVALLLSFKRLEMETHQLALNAHAEKLSQLIENGDDKAEIVSELGLLLRETVRIFKPGETINIILDRLDMCAEADRDDLVQMIAGLDKEASCAVKVLMIRQWTSDWDPNSREIKRVVSPHTPFLQYSKVQEIKQIGFW